MELITLKEFNRLPESEKKEIISFTGEILEYRSGRYKNFALYTVERFFVEVEISDNVEMINIKAFVSGKLLDKYTLEPETLKGILLP
ncbi:hypothetical protein NE848_08055 [Gramella jeungdoensis]|uniref:Crp/Fnr family transcriptional regulator n=1 Tax=Gramella jeungdoensis TaxID=708091 RepID=A0ABT0Z0T8_9FLAO|nr:hypothetical protein [Gramella jeungdoensis]MCM8569329.1 hypothetical protein [Gramella jeungdoensis]